MQPMLENLKLIFDRANIKLNQFASFLKILFLFERSNYEKNHFHDKNNGGSHEPVQISLA